MNYCDICENINWELKGHEPECSKCDYFQKVIAPEMEKSFEKSCPECPYDECTIKRYGICYCADDYPVADPFE